MFLHFGNTIINLDKVDKIRLYYDGIDFIFDVDELQDDELNPKILSIFEYEMGEESAADLYKTILKRLDNSKQLIDLDSTTKYGGWISVKDKLPEMSNCVLITDGESVEMSRYDEGVWHTESPCCYGEILYWQPLPDVSAIYQEIHGKEQKRKSNNEDNS